MKITKYEIYMKPSEVWDCEETYNVEDAEEVYNFAQNVIGLNQCDREQFIAVALDAKGSIIGYNVVSIGELNSAPVSTREIMKFLILANSAAAIFIHNHLSGIACPSLKDVYITQKLMVAGEIMNIEIKDHIIIGDGNSVSLKKSGLMDLFQ